MGGLTLTQKEQARLQVLNGVLSYQVGVEEAAEVLGVSVRHTWRILAAYRKEGAAALAHGNRGRWPANTLSAEIRRQVVALARQRYTKVNHTHLTELLAEREGLVVSRSTVRRLLLAAGMPSPRRRRPPRHRCRRERMPQEGMLVQIDGSWHDWLEGRGPWLSLLLAVDDATGTVPYALFREQEDAHGYFLLLREVILRRGIPLALYSDRHGVFQRSSRETKTLEEQVTGERQPTQFGRALRELGIRAVFARSPQAKGRVERVAGTFQDRLATELRLAGAASSQEADRVLWHFLPRFNERFGVPPVQLTSAYRSAEVDLAGMLCFKYVRKVARDNTVKYNWHTLQLLPTPDRPSYAGAQVEVQHRLDGSLVVCYQGRAIPAQEAPPRRTILRDLNGTRLGDTVTLGCLARGVSSNGTQGQEWLGMLGVPSERAAVGSLSQVRGMRVAHLQASPSRRPTPRQLARWGAVQEAMRQGLSLRAIARQLAIARKTVRKYAAAGSPPLYPERRPRANDSGKERRLTKSLNSLD
jgi:transposase